MNDLEAFKDKIFKGEIVKYHSKEAFLQEIRLCNGRFENYDVRYINADIASIITYFQRSYKDFISALEKETGLKFSQKDRLISFQMQNGSVILSADIFSEVLALLNTLESEDKMIVIIVGILAFTGFWSWNVYLKKQIETLRLNLQNSQDNEKNKQIKKLMKIINKMLLYANMQKSANAYKESIRKSLRDDESAYINAHKITNKSDFSNEFISDEIEEVKENYYKIISYNFTHKSFKIEGIGIPVNSSIIDEQSRDKIIKCAQKNQIIELKIKMIKDKNTGDFKEAYILKIVGNLFDDINMN